MEKKNNIKRILILVSVLVVLLIAFYLTTGAISKYTGFSVFNNNDNTEQKENSFSSVSSKLDKTESFDDFEECLKGQDITLFINSETPSESLKKIELSSYLNDIKIMNCLRDNEICLKKGVDSFPSWIINDKLIKKDISVTELSESSRCKLV